jgi:hypothetical protein
LVIFLHQFLIGKFKRDLTFGIHLHCNEFSTNQLKVDLG